MDTVSRDKSNLISNLFSGSKGTKVMVTTGYPTSLAAPTKTEIVDVVSGETCADLADFPLQDNSDAVGANLDGTPVVCGGYLHDSGINHEICYKLTIISGWQEFVSMKSKKSWAAALMFQDKFHIFGGRGWEDLLQTSEIISKDGGVEYGPELPSALTQHAITSINSTTSILSGGSTSATSYSPETWYFNHETDIFSSGPSLLEGRVDHGSATCVDKVTKERIPIVTGGYNHIISYVTGELDSTELLINGQWQSGTNHTKKRGPRTHKD